MPLQPGDRIERYIIDAQLGRGGMGEVYRAHDERLQRSVALKVLHLDGEAKEGSAPRSSSDGAARMLREARAVAALGHPNVVAIYDVGQLSEPEHLRGTTYLAMELIKGKPLRAYVGDAHVPMSTRLRWLADIARALGAAHAAGLVHRDVKPENVMIREDGVVKVLDFGIAKRAASDTVDPTSSTEGFVVPTTSQGTIMGTPMYMAPEQLRGEPLDSRADQFAWGVVAYELLTGRLPWSTEGGAIMLVSQILSAAPPPFAEGAGLAANVADTVMRALAKERGARFETMEALIAGFEGAISPAAGTEGFVPPSREGMAPASQLRVIVNEPRTPAVGAGSTLREQGARGSTLRGEAGSRGRRGWWVLAVGTVVVVAGAGVVAAGRKGVMRRGETADGSSEGRTGDAALATGCTSNRGCSAEHGGEAYVCRASDRKCVAIASEDCKATYEPGDLERDDTVWLGAIFPLKGPRAERFGTMNMDGADLARSEIAGAMAPLEDPSTPGHARPVALVECDDSEDAARAAHHLVDDVGVPGILGFSSGDQLLNLAGSLLIPHRVVAVASLTPNSLVTRLPQPENEPRLVWRTTYSFDALAEATAAAVHDVLEPRRHGSGKTHVVLVRSEAVSLGSFAESFYRNLVFNGKSALENAGAYQEVILSPKADGSLDAVVDQVVAAEPSIVVYLLNNGPLLEITSRIDARAKGRPIYLRPNAGTELFASFVGGSAERRRRVFAIASLSNSMPNARFVIRYNQERHSNVTRVSNPNQTYDAFYALAYASFALPPGARVVGSALAERFAHLVGPGKTIEVGPSGVFDALTILSAGGTIDLDGAAGPMDFDLKTGESSFDFALLCPAVDARGVANGDDVESGVVYRSKLHRLEGALECR